MACPFSINGNLGYVIGVLKGDGYCYIQKARKRGNKWIGGRNCRVGMSVTSLEFANKFNFALSNVLRKKGFYSIGVENNRWTKKTPSYWP